MRKKFIFQIIFSLAFIGLLGKIFLSEAKYLETLNVLISMKGFNLLLLLIVINLTVSFLFFHVLKKFSQKKISFIQITATFLQGGIVNQLIPGSGLVYKYFKFKSDDNINISEYSMSQLVFYIERIMAYLLLSILLGFLTIIYFNTEMILTLILSFVSLGFVFFLKRKYIYSFIKEIFYKNKNLEKIAFELSKIKAAIKNNLSYFILIFFLFLIQAILECVVFSQVFQIYSYDIGFEISSLLWMTTSLVTILSFMNFFGFFEVVFAYSSTFFDEEFTDIVIMVFGYRIMNLFAQFLLILSSYFYRLVNK
tara:strand:- start:114 stop:1040 length:927 start_codon:yes stop_codon:yes gene_type:complete